MKQSKENKISATLFFVSSTLFYIAAILNFFGGESAQGIMWLCLGSTFLCLGSLNLNKNKNKNNDNEQK